MNKTINLILTAVALGMGVGTIVLNMLNEIDISTALSMLSISVICLALVKLQQK